MRPKLTLSEAQRTGKIDEFIRQQEAELKRKRGSKSRLMAAIKRMVTGKSE